MRLLSPGEASRLLGVTPKALRLYERHGLVAPARSSKGWRGYGPEEMARLHQVLALKSLGLTLAAIGGLVTRPKGSLGAVLALQEEQLTRESARLTRALALVRAARATLAAGRELSVDDLAKLTRESTVTTQATSEELKAIFDPISEKCFSESERAALSGRKFDQTGISRQWEEVIADARAAMAVGDASTAQARDVARRWQTLVDAFTQGDAALAGRVRAVWNDAMSDPAVAPKLPLSPEIFAFMGKVMAALKEQMPGSPLVAPPAQAQGRT